MLFTYYKCSYFYNYSNVLIRLTYITGFFLTYDILNLPIDFPSFKACAKYPIAMK